MGIAEFALNNNAISADLTGKKYDCLSFYFKSYSVNFYSFGFEIFSYLEKIYEKIYSACKGFCNLNHVILMNITLCYYYIYYVHKLITFDIKNCFLNTSKVV